MPTPSVDSSLPDWAVLQADAARKIGHSLPEIERGLVAKGLTPALANSVINNVFEGRVRETLGPLEQAERSRMGHRLASVVVACVCLGLAYAFGGGLAATRTLKWLLVPMFCIWWAEVAGVSNSPRLIRWLAWLVLILIAGSRVLLLSL